MAGRPVAFPRSFGDGGRSGANTVYAAAHEQIVCARFLACPGARRLRRANVSSMLLGELLSELLQTTAEPGDGAVGALGY